MTARERLLHPVFLAAIGLLVFNDHWLEAHHGGWVTGKLSDAAGLTFFPILLLAIFAVPPTRRAVIASATVTAIGFALVKTVPAMTDLYRHGLGAVQWPFQAASAWVQGTPLPGLHPVLAVTDVSDLLALPFVMIPIWLAPDP